MGKSLTKPCEWTGAWEKSSRWLKGCRIRREMRRRAAVKPVIGHLKSDHRMNRNYLKGRAGDRANAVLAAAGYNFALLPRWPEELLRVLLAVRCRAAPKAAFT